MTEGEVEHASTCVLSSVYHISVVCNVQEGNMTVRFTQTAFNIVIAAIMVSTGTINTLAAK